MLGGTRTVVAGVSLFAGVTATAETRTWGGGEVPAPEPVSARITLGAYIFPGWYRDAGRGDYPCRTHDEDLVSHFDTQWHVYSKKTDLHYIVPVGSNWDDRPRARENALVITGKTPALFEKMCRDSLNYIDKRNNLAIIEAWNEWGEGSFIEPDKEFGFAFLDRVRKVYTDAPEAHMDFVPSEGQWSGSLDTLRLDIGTAGDKVEIDWIRFYR